MLILNIHQLFLLTFDIPFQYHHSYKKFENRSVGGGREKSGRFIILLKD